MPFTFAHPAVVLPLGRLPAKVVSLTALVIGSMLPDFEYFIRLRVKSIYSHTWPGLLWFDLPLGLVLYIVYTMVVKPALIANLPLFLNERFWGFSSGKPSILVVIASLLVGAITHILWDGFTHPAGYFVGHLPFLQSEIVLAGQRLPVYKLMQHASTFIGTFVIISCIIILPASQAKQSSHVLKYWCVVACTAFALVSLRILSGLKFYEYGNLIVTGIAGLFIGLIVASVSTNATSK